MKFNKTFLISICVFLGLIFLLQMNMPQRFQWNPSFRHTDKQPFGCYVMDSLLSVSMPGRYQVTRQTLWQLSQGSVRRGIIVHTRRFSPTQTDLDALFRLVRSGSTVMVVAGWTDMHVDSLFHADVSGGDDVSMFYLRMVQRRGGGIHDTLIWVGDQQRYQPQTYVNYDFLTGGTIYVNDPALGDVPDYDTLLVRRYWSDEYTWHDENDSLIHERGQYNHDALAISLQEGRGRLIICVTPFLLTNYAVLNDGSRNMLFRLMSQFDDLPVVRTEAYLDATLTEQESPLGFFLMTPPLKWAVYLAMLGLLLFFIFTARRRQRVIPVVKEPENKSMEFVQLIGTLYHQQHDNVDLVKKKYLYFAERLRREVMVDVDDTAEEEQTVGLLAEHTGMAREHLRYVLRQVRSVCESEGTITDAEMKEYIDEMGEILRKI